MRYAASSAAGRPPTTTGEGNRPVAESERMAGFQAGLCLKTLARARERGICRAGKDPLEARHLGFQTGPRAPLWHYALVGALAAVIVLWELGASALDEHECHVALAARTMAQPKDEPWLIEGAAPYDMPPHNALNRWMVPVANGRPRLVKTPLAYWCAAITARACRALGLPGGNMDERTARLPSAAAAVLLVLVVLALGRRMFSARAALLGAVLLATSAGFQKWGRSARPEMLLCLFMTLAMTCFYFGLEARGRSGRIAWMMASWAALGFGNLAKEFVPLLLAWPLVTFLLWRQSSAGGSDSRSLKLLRRFFIVSGAGLAVHIAVTSIPVLHWWTPAGLRADYGAYLTMTVTLAGPVVWYLLRTKGWRQLQPLLPTAAAGTAIMLAMFVPWILYMQHLFPGLAGQVVSSQVFERTAGAGGWSVRPAYVYIFALASMSLPWVVFLPGALAAGLLKRFAEKRRSLVYLLVWSVGLLGLFSAAAGKREHYILPALPALCLLMGFVADDVFFRHKWITARLARMIGAGYGAVGAVGFIGAAAAVIVVGHGAESLALSAVAALAGGLAAVAGLLSLRERFRAVVGLLVAAMAFGYLGFYAVEPNDPDEAIRSFALAAARIVPAEDEVFGWVKTESNLVFYFGRPIPDLRWRHPQHCLEPQAAKAPPAIDQCLAALPDRPAWLFARRKEADPLRVCGYRYVLSVPPSRRGHGVPTLYRHRREK